MGVFLAQHYVAFLVASELIEQFLLGDSLAILLFCAEIFRDGEVRHDRCIVNGVGLYLVEHLNGIAERLWHIGKDLVHLLASFEPFLLGIKHTVRVVEILARAQADKAVVSFGVFFVDKMHVV